MATVVPIHPLDLTYVNVVQYKDQKFTVCHNAWQLYTADKNGTLDYILGDKFVG